RRRVRPDALRGARAMARGPAARLPPRPGRRRRRGPSLRDLRPDGRRCPRPPARAPRTARPVGAGGAPMTRERPTLAELRTRVFKGPIVGPARPGGGPHRDGTIPHGRGSARPRDDAPGNVLARRWGRPAAVYGTWLAVRLGLSAN